MKHLGKVFREFRTSGKYSLKDQIRGIREIEYTSGFVCSCNLQRESQGRDSPLRPPGVVALTRSIEIADVAGVWLHAEHSLNSRRCRNEKSRLFTHCQSDAHGSYNGHLSLPSSNWQRV